MQITVLVTDLQNVATAKGGYSVLEVTYKDQEGKSASRKLMSFGTTAPAFNALKNAVKGEVYTIERKDEVSAKDGKTYKNWASATKFDGSTPFPTLNSGDTTAPAANKPAFTPGGKTTSTYETPEERAKKQIYIVRQSSITAALSFLKEQHLEESHAVRDVLNIAAQFEEFVFNGTIPDEIKTPVVAKKATSTAKKSTVVESFDDLEEQDEFNL